MFKILDEVCTPKRGTKYSAYVDLFAREDVVIGAGETKVVPLGIKIDLEGLRASIAEKYLNPYYDYSNKEIDSEFYEFLESNYLEVALRSSLAVKGLIIANGFGIIDLDYQDEIGLVLHNPINKVSNVTARVRYGKVSMIANLSGQGDGIDGEYIISKGDRVAQATLKGHKGFLLGYESDVVRDGGYGSTGK